MSKGPDTSALTNPTAQEYALSETAAKQWNEYLTTKPYSEAYLKDIQQDPATAAQRVQGQAITDLAVKYPLPEHNPNTGMSAGMTPAKTRISALTGLGRDAVSQKAAGEKVYLENAMGLQSTANTAQAGMAGDAVKRSLTDAEAGYTNAASTGSSVATGMGAFAGLAKDYYLNKKQ